MFNVICIVSMPYYLGQLCNFLVPEGLDCREDFLCLGHVQVQNLGPFKATLYLDPWYSATSMEMYPRRHNPARALSLAGAGQFQAPCPRLLRLKMSRQRESCTSSLAEIEQKIFRTEQCTLTLCSPHDNANVFHLDPEPSADEKSRKSLKGLLLPGIGACTSMEARWAIRALQVLELILRQGNSYVKPMIPLVAAFQRGQPFSLSLCKGLEFQEAAY